MHGKNRLRVGTMRAWVWWTAVLVQCLVASWTVELTLAQGGSGTGMPLVSAETGAMQQLQLALDVPATAWPGQGDPCTTWQGVVCINGHVDTLQLTGLPRGVSGTPLSKLDALLSLPFLRSLNASECGLSGSIPDWFGRLGTLESLDLTACSLNGSIPDSLGSLSSLTNLSLSQNTLSGIIPPSFGNFINLTSLSLSSNSLVGPIPSSLFNATHLTALDLSNNNLSGQIPGDVGKLAGLQYLSLANNVFNGSVPADLGKLSLLVKLDLSSNILSGSIPPEFGSLAKLSSLNLAANNLSGVIPPNITQCTGLQVLLLNRNFLSNEVPQSIGTLQRVVSIDLSVNRLTGTYPPGLASLQLLQRLDLSHNYFYGPLPPQLANLQNLLMLNASNNFFNSSLPLGLIPSAVVKKNCLSDEWKQHSLRTCTRFYGRKGIAFDGFNTPGEARPPTVLPYGTTTPAQSEDRKSKHIVPILGGVLGGLGLILMVVSLLFCLHMHERDTETGKDCSIESGVVAPAAGAAAVTGSLLGEPFTYAQLQHATKNFALANLITNGHSGDLYRGVLDGRAAVVVKRIDLNKGKRDAYLGELEVFSRASHTRLVSLLGHCLDREDDKFLVYKYTPNGDLASALHKKGSPGPCQDVLQSLDWITRLKIAIGIAEGLAYLHCECSPPIVHSDVKASSILLDDKFEVRLGSFSEARVQDGDWHPNIITRLLGLSQSSDQGDPGSPMVSCTYDVYTFGKVLLELVSGKLGISGTTDPGADSWLEWALPLINVHDKESLPKLVDPSLIVDEDLLEEVWAMAIIAKACLHAKPSKRPSMRHILRALENPHKVVREESFGESLAVRTSSHSSWNEALFGSWRAHHNNLQNVSVPGIVREEYSTGSLPIAKATGVASTSTQSTRGESPQGQDARHGSSDIAPKPIDEPTQGPATR